MRGLFLQSILKLIIYPFVASNGGFAMTPKLSIQLRQNPVIPQNELVFGQWYR
jgi:hypothetical protein